MSVGSYVELCREAVRSGPCTLPGLAELQDHQLLALSAPERSERSSSGEMRWAWLQARERHATRRSGGVGCVAAEMCDDVMNNKNEVICGEAYVTYIEVSFHGFKSSPLCLQLYMRKREGGVNNH